jgi:hypothetical protein
MLPQLINLMLSQGMAPEMKKNLMQIQQSASKFEAAYQSLGKALTDEQQVLISKNLDKFDGFFKSDDGKEVLSMFVDEFEKFTKA